MNKAPLQDLRVIDLGNVLGGPFAATLLADFGAEVIKIERPGTGDSMRDVGPSGPTGPVWWKSMGRGKRSLALDWKQPKARSVLERLVRVSDVLVENFRPDVLERNGFGPDVLLQWNPDLIILRVSGYGQTGPYRSQPGFGKALEAFSGLCDLTGFPDGPPVHPGFPLADMTTGLMGAFGIMVAIHAREKGLARGQVIDLPLYEAPLRLIDSHIPWRTATGLFPTRNGNQQVLSFGLSGVYRTRDHKWITYSAASYAVARRVLKLVGGSEWENEARFRTLQDICKYDAEIGHTVCAWVSERTADEVILAFKEAEAVAALIYNVDDILADPHIAARNNIVSFEGEPCKVINVVPKLSETPGEVRWLGRGQPGEDTSSILKDLLALDESTIQDLIKCGAVAQPG